MCGSAVCDKKTRWPGLIQWAVMSTLGEPSRTSGELPVLTTGGLHARIPPKKIGRPRKVKADPKMAGAAQPSCAQSSCAPSSPTSSPPLSPPSPIPTPTSITVGHALLLIRTQHTVPPLPHGHRLSASSTAGLRWVRLRPTPVPLALQANIPSPVTSVFSAVSPHDDVPGVSRFDALPDMLSSPQGDISSVPPTSRLDQERRGGHAPHQVRKQPRTSGDERPQSGLRALLDGMASSMVRKEVAQYAALARRAPTSARQRAALEQHLEMVYNNGEAYYAAWIRQQMVATGDHTKMHRYRGPQAGASSWCVKHIGRCRRLTRQIHVQYLRYRDATLILLTSCLCHRDEASISNSAHPNLPV